MVAEEWESSLLREAESLKALSGLLDTFQNVLEIELGENGDFLDDGLHATLEYLSIFVSQIRNDGMIFEREQEGETEKVKIPSITAQLSDVLEEIDIFQAGKPAKEKK